MAGQIRTRRTTWPRRSMQGEVGLLFNARSATKFRFALRFTLWKSIILTRSLELNATLSILPRRSENDGFR
jgi:hypothetical protein